MTRSHTAPARLLTALFAGMGVLHWARPAPFDGIVPRVLPGRARVYTLASGAAELVVAGLLARPSSRRAGGAAAVALLIAVFPANVQMALDARHASPVRRGITLGRLPLQGVLVALALRAGARGGSEVPSSGEGA